MSTHDSHVRFMTGRVVLCRGRDVSRSLQTLLTGPPRPTRVLFYTVHTALPLYSAKLTFNAGRALVAHVTLYTVHADDLRDFANERGPTANARPKHARPARVSQLYTRALFASPSRPTRPALREPSVYSAPTSTPVSSTPVSTCYVSGPVSGPPTHPSPHPPRPPP